jgi:Zn-dependent metalloprotease
MASFHRPHGVVPPIILEHIATHAESADQRQNAVRSLSLDHSLRMQRLTASTRPGRPAAQGGAEEVNRTIYTADGTEVLPGTLVRSEGQPASDDVAVDEAYDGLGATYTFYQDIFGRDSIDDEGLPLLATVHYGDHYDNAFWNGTQMVFGDGDGEIFNRFTISLDVIGHELTHGVTEDETGLNYINQPGALNESASDVFGSLVKQYAKGQTADQADWLIGEGLFTASVNGTALRSMKEPGTAYDDPRIGKDPQPAHMDHYVVTTRDNGGVHINSGIPNHAFYLAATAFGGHAWEQAGRIWYDALRDPRVRPTARFRTFARATVRAALQAFGSDEAAVVVDAWRGVGIVAQ